MYCHVWDKKKQLRLMEAAVEFVWWGGVGWGGGGVRTVIFMSNPTTVLRLRCVVAGVVTAYFREDVKDIHRGVP